eukprot:SAG11_NODE_5496_length_1544_cov_1.144637_2_plen_59_part_00
MLRAIDRINQVDFLVPTAYYNNYHCPGNLKYNIGFFKKAKCDREVIALTFAMVCPVRQ